MFRQQRTAAKASLWTIDVNNHRITREQIFKLNDKSEKRVAQTAERRASEHKKFLLSCVKLLLAYKWLSIGSMLGEVCVNVHGQNMESNISNSARKLRTKCWASEKGGELCDYWVSPTKITQWIFSSARSARSKLNPVDELASGKWTRIKNKSVMDNTRSFLPAWMGIWKLSRTWDERQKKKGEKWSTVGREIDLVECSRSVCFWAVPKVTNNKVVFLLLFNFSPAPRPGIDCAEAS